MAFQFPWTNFHELNLDWFLSKFKQFTDNFLGTTATAESVPYGTQPSVTVTGGELDEDTDVTDPFTFNFKIPAGQPGQQGEQGVPGQNGFSPIATVTKSGTVATITITDVNGTTSTTISDGEVTQEQLDEVKSALTSVRVDIGAPFVTFTPIAGKYIYNNTEKSGNAFSRSEPIAVSKGDIVEFTATGYSNLVAMIATTNASGTTFTDVVHSTDSAEHTYTYTATADGYVVVSYDHRQPYSLVIKGEASNTSLNNRLTAFEESGVNYISNDIELTVVADSIPVTIGQTGHFINVNGVNSTSSAFNMSTTIALDTADYIRFNAKGYLQNVAVLARVNEDSTYSPLIVSEDSDEHTFRYMATEPMNVVISTNKNVTPIYSIFNSRVDKNDARITSLENDWVAFATIGIIGDSLASGASNYPNGTVDRPVYSWGKYIEREHGITVYLFSFGGATTRSWFIDSRGQTALNNGNVLDCYVIGLGVNDAYSLGSSYLGSISDVHVGSESQNPDTYYGNYSKIIATIKAKSPRAKIFCITNPKNTASIAGDFNDAIKAISALYTNVYVIDLVNDAFYQSKEFTDTWYGAHSTALGYKLISKNLYTHISDIIKNHISEFTDIQWIVENHE